MQGFALADEVLLFRQKDPKPLSPVRGPPGASASVPNKMARELAPLKQPSPRGRFGTEAPPRPTRESKIEAKNTGATIIIRNIGCSILLLRWVRRSRSPNRPLWRKLFERIELRSPGEKLDQKGFRVVRFC